MIKSSLEQIQEKLDEYRANYDKVKAALIKNSESTQDDLVKSQREKDLQQLLLDIEKAVTYHQDLLKLSKSQIETYFSSVKLKPSDIGRKCNLYYEKDENWYPGEINSINISEQTAEVTFLGFAENHKVPASYIQIIIPPKISDLQEGQDVEGLLQDGKWHYGSIEKLEEGAVTIRIARWGHIHTLTLDSIRLVTDPKISILQRDTFVIPAKLKILPNDTEAVRMKKKKKVKAMKKAWRESQIEKETKTYVSSWKSFQQKNSNKKESIFQTPDTYVGKVGVPNSGRGMTVTNSKISLDEDFNHIT